jgi:hypothetical protein
VLGHEVPEKLPTRYLSELLESVQAACCAALVGLWHRAEDFGGAAIPSAF